MTDDPEQIADRIYRSKAEAVNAVRGLPLTVLVEVRCGAKDGRCRELLAEVGRVRGGTLVVRYQPFKRNRQHQRQEPIGDAQAIPVGPCRWAGHNRAKLSDDTKAQGGMMLSTSAVLEAIEQGRRSIPFTRWPEGGGTLPA